jgi:hypothetical protein
MQLLKIVFLKKCSELLTYVYPISPFSPACLCRAYIYMYTYNTYLYFFHTAFSLSDFTLSYFTAYAAKKGGGNGSGRGGGGGGGVGGWLSISDLCLLQVHFTHITLMSLLYLVVFLLVKSKILTWTTFQIFIEKFFLMCCILNTDSGQSHYCSPINSDFRFLLYCKSPSPVERIYQKKSTFLLLSAYVATNPSSTKATRISTFRSSLWVIFLCCGWDLADVVDEIYPTLWMISSRRCGCYLAECGWDLADSGWVVRMVRASGDQCRSRNSPLIPASSDTVEVESEGRQMKQL